VVRQREKRVLLPICIAVVLRRFSGRSDVGLLSLTASCKRAIVHILILILLEQANCILEHLQNPKIKETAVENNRWDVQPSAFGLVVAFVLLIVGMGYKWVINKIVSNGDSLLSHPEGDPPADRLRSGHIQQKTRVDSQAAARQEVPQAHQPHPLQPPQRRPVHARPKEGTLKAAHLTLEDQGTDPVQTAQSTLQQASFGYRKDQTR